MATSITNTSVTTDNLTVDTNTIHVDSANNRVGIGTASPTQDLTIVNSGDARMELVSGTSGTSIIDMGDSADKDIGGIRYLQSSDTLQFRAGNDVRMSIDANGHITSSSQPSAQSRPAANITNVTGDASTYYSQQGNSGTGTPTYTDIFDQNLDMLNGTFTAPVTGRYLACINIEFQGVDTNHSSGVFYINTSNRNYQRLFRPDDMSNVGTNCGLPMAQIVDADANDVIRWALYIAGSGKTITITTNTNFGVHLLS